MRRYEDAIAILSNVVRLPDESGAGYVQLCWAYFHTGRNEDMSRVLQEGLERFPESPDLRWFAERLNEIRNANLV
jgi:hypothetical protein